MSVMWDVVGKVTELNDQSHNNIKRKCAWKLIVIYRVIKKSLSLCFADGAS